jgi:hypothetical protein
MAGSGAVSAQGAAEWGAATSAVRGPYRAIERLDDGSTANTESGPLTGAHLTAWREGGGWRIGIAADRLSGRVDYRGRSQVGLPVRTHSRIGIDEIALDASRSLALVDTVTATATAAAGQRRIDRRIEPSLLSTPLTEVLNWRFAQIGAQARWAVSDRWTAAVGIRIEQGLTAKLDVDFHGVAEPVRLAPTLGHPGHRLNLELGRTIANDLGLVLIATHSRQAYGASSWQDYRRGGATVSRVRYPGSTQRLDDIALALTWRWR